MNDIIAGIAVPRSPFTHGVPLRLCALIGDTCQTGATPERLIAYARDAVPDRDTCQTGATPERILAYARDAVRDRDACQTGAIAERSIAYARHAVRDRDTCQTAATVEGIVAYARDAVRDRDLCCQCTIDIQMVGIIQRVCSTITKRYTAPCREVGDINGSQTGATGERTIAYTRHAVSYRHAR